MDNFLSAQISPPSSPEQQANLMFPEPLKVSFANGKLPLPRKFHYLLPGSNNNDCSDNRISTFIKQCIRKCLSPLLPELFWEHFNLSISHVCTSVTFPGQEEGQETIRLNQAKFIENSCIRYLCKRCQERNCCSIVAEGLFRLLLKHSLFY
jgi:hypothetical protein